MTSKPNRTLHRAVGTAAAVALLSVGALHGHEPREWPDSAAPGSTAEERFFNNQCPRAGFAVDDPLRWQECWNPHTRFTDFVNDPAANQNDGSHNSNPQPASSDIVSGADLEEASFWYGFWTDAPLHSGTFVNSGVQRNWHTNWQDCRLPPLGNGPCPISNQATLCSNQDPPQPGCEPDGRAILYVAMRLDSTPVRVSGSDYPWHGEHWSGPFRGNTAWNFLIDLTGDGWSNFIISVDGNEGSSSNPYNQQVLAWNDSTTLQEYNENFSGQNKGDQRCSQTPQGDILFKHAAQQFAGPPITGCHDSTTAQDCDFGITRVIRVDNNPTNSPNCCGNADFILMMQMPVDWFVDCRAWEPGGPVPQETQLLHLDTPMTMCVTTSTQPNDYTGKDLALPAGQDFRMRKDKPLACTDACTLANGCGTTPVPDPETSCEDDNIVMINAKVMDTIALDANDEPVSNVISVDYYYVAEDANGVVPSGREWTHIGQITSPTGNLNDFEIVWDTVQDVVPGTECAIQAGGECYYRLRLVVENQQNNVYDDAPIRVNVMSATCDHDPNPVTLAELRAQRDGRLVRFSWTTATEVGNLGFDLLARSPGGEWERLNAELIPAQGIDSVDPHTYHFEVYDVEDTLFALEDVDIRGRTTRHGPFRVAARGAREPIARAGSGHEHHSAPGTRRAEVDIEADFGASDEVVIGAGLHLEPIDWAAIRGTRSQKEAQLSVRTNRLASRKGPGGTPEVELLVDRDGLYRVTYEELAAAGFDFSAVRAQHLALVNQGAAVPMHVAASGQHFGPGSTLTFWGTSLDSLYTDTNVYRLRREPSQARRVDEAKGGGGGASPATYQATTRFERQRQYTFASPIGDPWFDTAIVANRRPASASFTLPAEGYVPGGGPVTLSADVWGVTNWPRRPDHHVRISVNGQAIGSQRFNGPDAATVTGVVPEGVLQPGNNTITVELPQDTGVPWEVVYLDGFTLTYPRHFQAVDGALSFTSSGPAFQVAGLSDPQVEVWRLDGPMTRLAVSVSSGEGGYVASFSGGTGSGEYTVASGSAVLTPGLRSGREPVDITGGRADYLVISHGDFIEGLQPLVTAREADGLAVRVVDVADVYAQFGHGIFGAEPIRDYIRHAARHMRISYVLLVGGDTSDYRDYLGLGSVSFIPSLYARTGDLVNHAPVDPLYADLTGNGVPDLAIGRLPVRTPQELATVIDKTLAYQHKSYPGTAVFAADVYDQAFKISYSNHSNHLINSLPGAWEVERAYLDSGKDEARNRLLGALEDGVALTSWTGHSGATAWSLQGLFSAGDAAGLQNHGRPTVVSQWGCWNTYHVSPRYHTMAHRLLLSGHNGAAAVLGSATLSSATSDLALGKLVTPLLAQPGMTLGEAMTQAKQAFAIDRPHAAEALLGWTLLGDPALRVQP